MEKQFQFVIIGCGAISEIHGRAVSAISEATLYGVYDKNPQKAKDFASRYNCKLYERIDDIFKDSSVDIVNICSHSGSHAELAVAAANAGKHVIVEKPMAINAEDAQTVVCAQEKNNVKICVISQLRFSNAISAVRSAVQKNLLGKLVLCSLSMRYYRSSEYYSASDWRGKWASDGGGALMNQGIHGVDLLTYLCGNVKSVRGIYKTLVHDIETEDTLCAMLEFDNGAVGTIEASTAVQPGHNRRIEISGSMGSITLTEGNISAWELKTPMPSMPAEIPNDTANNPTALDITGHRLQIENLLNAVQGKQELLIDANEGKKAVDIILGIYKSAQTGETIYL